MRNGAPSKRVFTCEQCGTEMETGYETQRFCSAICRQQYWLVHGRRAREHYERCPIAQEEEKALNRRKQ